MNVCVFRQVAEPMQNHYAFFDEAGEQVCVAVGAECTVVELWVGVG